VRADPNTSATELLPIGEIARRSGVATSALRSYERRGLITPERVGSDPRRYQRAVLRRIAFIGFARRAGLTLDEIGTELAKVPPHHAPMRRDWSRLAAYPCAAVRIANMAKPHRIRIEYCVP
jgi:MerR family redox-sensitive transcriptional activator SoxR